MAYEPMRMMDYEEALLQRNLAYANYLDRMERMQSMAKVQLRPYRDEYFDLSKDPYAGDNSDDGEDRDVEDSSVRSFINKLLFNVALDVNDGLMYDQDEYEELDNMYPHWVRRSTVSNNCGDDDAFVRSSFQSEAGITYNRTPRRNPNKKLKKRRKKNAEDKESDKFPFCISGHEDGHPLFTASVYHLRDYIRSEVETQVRTIHQYYEDQFMVVNKERMTALAQLIKAKETCIDVQKRLEQAESHLQQYKTLCDNLATQVKSGKEARRRRRLAKKHRKTDITTPFDGDGDGKEKDEQADSD